LGCAEDRACSKPVSRFCGAAGATNIYFESFLDSYDTGDFFSTTRLDPDEGALLVAFYSQASIPHH
jgi:hypothetical protein